MTIKELIKQLQSYLDNNICDENVQILFGNEDIGNCVKKAYYNNSEKQSNAPWFGEFIILE